MKWVEFINLLQATLATSPFEPHTYTVQCSWLLSHFAMILIVESFKLTHLPNLLHFSPKYWVGGGLLLCASSLVIAQEALRIPSLNHQVDEAFRQVLKNPTNQEVTLQYARLLIASGNYEGGVAALERLLLNADPQPSIRVELAVLYYRLGSYQMSENLLRQALDDTRLANEQRTMAQILLRDATARNQPSQLSGMVMLGLRQQSNPSARSDAEQVYAAGSLTPLVEGFKPKSDTDIQLTARLDYRYDLGLQNEATLVHSLVVQNISYPSSSDQRPRVNQATPYDLAWGEFTTGVRLKPATVDLPGLRVRSYLILAELLAQGHRYLNNHGLGLDAEYQINEKTLVHANYEYRYYRYATRVDMPAADQLGGPDNHLRLQLNQEIAPSHLISAELSLRQHQTGLVYYDYHGEEIRLTYSTSYPSPLPSVTGGHWSSTVWASVGQRTYGAADPSITADVSRKDWDWRMGVGLSLPISSNWSTLIQLENANVHSTLPNYQFKNTSLMGAVVYRF